MLGVETVAKSPADGYTLLATTDVVSSAPYIMSFNVDYVKDLMPVIELIHFPQVLAVHPSLGVRTVAELIAAAKHELTLAQRVESAEHLRPLLDDIRSWQCQIDKDRKTLNVTIDGGEGRALSRRYRLP
jgi:hypothetical protein